MLAVIAAGYLHVLGAPFQYDDLSSIRDNPALDRPTDLGAIWRFRPPRFIVHLSLAWNLALTGRAPWGLRLVNLLIHFAAALLVGWIASELARRLRGPPAGEAESIGLVAALLFAAHPLATQAVTYLIQRTASLAAALELLAVALYLRARDRPGWVLWIASWAVALLAAFTKEMAVALPVAIAFLEWRLRRAGARGAPWARLVPYALVIPAILLSTRLPAGELGRAVTNWRETADISRLSYLATQLTVVPRYLGLWLWPAGQNLDPDVPVRAGFDAAAGLGLALLAAVTAAAFALGRRAPLVPVGWAWFLITLAPESSVFPIRDVMVEHRAYLPMAGLAWGVACLIVSVVHGVRARHALVAAIVIALVTVTVARNRVWRTPESLWSDVTRKSPAKARGFENLGLAVQDLGRFAAAESLYAQAIALDSSDVYARVNLGALRGRQGRYRDAIEVLDEAQSLAPDQIEVLTNLGNAWWGLGDTTRAATYYERALVVAPGATRPALNLRRMRGEDVR